MSQECVEGFNLCRITQDSDIILPRNYSYWQNINAHKNLPTMFVFMGTPSGPCLWEIDKRTFEVFPKGKMFPDGFPPELLNSTAEGWYFSAFDPFRIYCPTDTCLYQYDIKTKNMKAMVYEHNFDFGEGSHVLRQFHSSYDETVHSCSVLQKVEDGAWPKIGSLVCQNLPSVQHKYYPARGALDECQVDKSGRWLVIKEDNDHRVVNLITGEEAFLSDENGALGHSDNGFGYAIGADNWQQLAAWRLHYFATGTSQIVYECPWDLQILHASHGNAMLMPPGRQWFLGSGTDPYLRKIFLDGSFESVMIAPTMCVGDDYDNLPKASLDPYGEFAFWIRGGGHYDAFLVRVP